MARKVPRECERLTLKKAMLLPNRRAIAYQAVITVEIACHRVAPGKLRAGREALAEFRLGPARLMRAQWMTSRKVSACLRDYSHRAPRRTRSSSNDLNFFKAQVAHAEAEPG